MTTNKKIRVAIMREFAGKDGNGASVKIGRRTLKSIADTYNADGNSRAPFKFGHRDNGEAKGWVESVDYLDGKLYATIGNFTKEAVDKIKQKAHRFVSASVFPPDNASNPQQGKGWFLRHLAAVNEPAIPMEGKEGELGFNFESGEDDDYIFTSPESLEFDKVSDNKEKLMSENKVETIELEAHNAAIAEKDEALEAKDKENAELKAKVAEFEADQTTGEKEINDLKKQVEELRFEAVTAKNEAKVDKLIADGIVAENSREVVFNAYQDAAKNGCLESVEKAFGEKASLIPGSDKAAEFTTPPTDESAPADKSEYMPTGKEIKEFCAANDWKEPSDALRAEKELIAKHNKGE